MTDDELYVIASDENEAMMKVRVGALRTLEQARSEATARTERDICDEKCVFRPWRVSVEQVI